MIGNKNIVLEEEKEFYKRFQWAIMPFLTFKELIERINWHFSIDINSLPNWCKKEIMINLYMLSAAAADISDDYLVRGIVNLSKLNDYIPFTSWFVRLIREISSIKRIGEGLIFDRKIKKWREFCSDWLIFLCKYLISDEVVTKEKWEEMKIKSGFLNQYSYPKKLLNMRARIPAAFRSQDLTHYDFLKLGKYIEKKMKNDFKQIVIGLRTAGSFIAPVICTYLLSKGYEHTSYMTIRPKNYLHPWDKKEIKRRIDGKTQFILIDEPPNTGKSLAGCVKMLKSFGVESERIIIGVPVHPAGTDWLDDSLRKFLQGIEIITLDSKDWYKEQLLNRDNFENAIKPYFKSLGFDNLYVYEDEKTRAINDELLRNPDKSYHVRLKKVYRVITSNKKGSYENFMIMGKSVGWGWLSYHAAISALRLEGLIPRIFGLKDGIIYLEWIENDEGKDKTKINYNNIEEKLAEYISRRANELKLRDDPSPFLSNYREGGLQTIAIILSKIFGTRVSKLKRGWVRNKLEKIICPNPTFIDSRMQKREWINSINGYKKIDFEHHGFGKTATHNISDPAYDIAMASLEFDLDERNENRLIDLYIEKTGDKSIKGRLFYYKLLVGVEAMEEAIKNLNLIRGPHEYGLLNKKYTTAWKFLVSETMRRTAALCMGTPKKSWESPIFVMDIDDVLDKNIFGFPCTTANGIRAISILREHDICVIINTARSFEEVKDYCKHYGFPGGIAEYGSVIWDDIEMREIVIANREALEELNILRDELAKIPGVFINPYYKYSIRAYCYNRERTTPVPDAVIGELFAYLKIRWLSAKKSYIDTAIYDKSVNKGKALIKLRELKKLKGGKIGAIGDTESDFPMLIVADEGFLVKNSSIELKRKARNFGIKIMRKGFTSGLFEAVTLFLHNGGYKLCQRCKKLLKNLDRNNDTLWVFLKIADMNRIQHWIRAIDRNIFEIFKE